MISKTWIIVIKMNFQTYSPEYLVEVENENYFHHIRIIIVIDNVAQNLHGSSDICLMGFIYSIQICEICSSDIWAWPLQMSNVSDDFS